MKSFWIMVQALTIVRHNIINDYIKSVSLFSNIKECT